MGAASPTGFRDVLNEELSEIEIRRQQVELPPVCGGSPEADQAMRLSGLALSGGGPRSACVGLGLLQALYRSGLLRHVDYLSTVSGGGYVGSYLSSWVSATNNRIDWRIGSRETPVEPEKAAELPAAGNSDGHTVERRQSTVPLPFFAERNAPQPEAVCRLANQGEALRQPLKFFSHHFWGFLLVNAFFLNVVLTLGVSLAFVFRILDLEPVMDFVEQLGFYGDARRAFLPAAVAFVLWLFSLRLQESYRRRNIESSAGSTRTYLLFVLMVVLGIVSLFSLGNLSTDAIQASYGIPPQEGDRIRGILDWTGKGLLVLLGAAVTPYLSLRSLLRSGLAPRWQMEAWVFNIASYAILAGIPLFIFSWVARENISGWNQSRPDSDQMRRGHFRDWEKFLSQMSFANAQGESSTSRTSTKNSALYDSAPPNRGTTPSKSTASDNVSIAFKKRIVSRFDDVSLDAVPSAVQPSEAASRPKPKKPPADANANRQEVFYKVLRLQRECNDVLAVQWLPEYWLYAAGAALHVEDTFQDQMRDRRRLKRWKDQLTEAFNSHVLSDPYLFTPLEGLTAADPKTNESNAWPKGLPSLADCVNKAKSLKYSVSRSLNNLQTQPTDVAAWLREREKSLTEEKEKATQAYRIRSPELEAALQQNLSQAVVNHAQHVELLRQIRLNNWNLMRAAFLQFEGQDLWYSSQEVFAAVVIEKDQITRLRILGWSLLSLLLLGTLFNINPTLLHSYYRDQLAEQWIAPHPQYGKRVPLAELKNCAKGAPFHLLSGTYHLLGKLSKVDQENTGRFSFSKTHIGGGRIDYCRAASYLKGKYELADAMAVSGAAVTTTGLDNVLARILLLLSNFRLGQWLPNPSHLPGDHTRPTPLALLYDFLFKDPLDRRYLFVCDGGYVDNTGIAALLQRRCRVMIACDAGQDGKYEFADLRKLLAEATSRYGFQFSTIEGTDPIPLQKIAPKNQDQSRKDASSLEDSPITPKSDHCHLVIKVTYPDDELTRQHLGTDHTGYLIYVKPALTGKEPADLLHYRKTKPEFPHDPTLELCFDPEQFQMYRRMGERLGDVVAEECFQAVTSSTPLWQWNPPAHSNANDSDRELISKLHGPVSGELLPDIQKILDSQEELSIKVLSHYLLAEDGRLRQANKTVRRRLVPILQTGFNKAADDAVLHEILRMLEVAGYDDPDVKSFLEVASRDSRHSPATRQLCEVMLRWLQTLH